jgi:LuxR family transcriptional regulator, maltose regulon positive regulatory protein
MFARSVTWEGSSGGTTPYRQRLDRMPVVPDPWVERPRLLARIDVAVERPLTLVIAPAGAGKSVTLARWARDHADVRVRWLNAHQDLDVRSLGCQLLRGADGAPEELLLDGSVEEQIAELCEALEPLTAREVVVVDDAHELPHSCFVLLGELLNRCPDSVQLVLLNRWDPPVPLLLLEIQEKVSVLRGHQLRMTAAEAMKLLVLHAGAHNGGHADAIVRYADGWAAVLVLAGQQLRRDPGSVSFTLEQVTSSGLGLADALASEVFSSLVERQRHVLLCIAAEPAITRSDAARLTGDPQAGVVLEDLERVGLLVSREPSPTEDTIGQVRFRLHPLLLEVLRRRMAAGGVEVLRARAVVLKAASLDRAYGDVESALRRMLWVRALEEAADLVAELGLDLLAAGHAEDVHRLAAAAPDVIAGHPGTWLAMALTRRRQGAVAEAAHWCQRILARRVAEGNEAGPGTGPDEFDLALVHLIRCAGGNDDMHAAVDDADELIERGPGPVSPARRALLLVELASAETWLGRFASAASHLATSVAMCRQSGFGGLLPEALSRLAVAELLQARNVAAIEAATEVLELAPRGRGSPDECRDRAGLVLELAHQQTLPWALMPPAEPATQGAPESDATTALLRLLLTARLAAARGTDGRTALAGSPQLPLEMSRQMSVLLDLERCAYAIEAGDAIGMRALSAHLSGIGAEAEATCLDAALADMESDLSRADELLARVLSGQVEPLGPFVLPHALVSAAQIADGRGNRQRADALMLDAVRATAPQRYVVPFLGWSFHGSPVPVLLARLAAIEDSPWRRELHQAVTHLAQAGRAHNATLPTHMDTARPAVQMQASVPPLTRRETDVLFELAHGSSYADIAATLVITENTVKTHVSSLYAKLGVTRRSHALHTARAAGLI